MLEVATLSKRERFWKSAWSFLDVSAISDILTSFAQYLDMAAFFQVSNIVRGFVSLVSSRCCRTASKLRVGLCVHVS